MQLAESNSHNSEQFMLLMQFSQLTQLMQIMHSHTHIAHALILMQIMQLIMQLNYANYSHNLHKSTQLTTQRSLHNLMQLVQLRVTHTCVPGGSCFIILLARISQAIWCGHLWSAAWLHHIIVVTMQQWLCALIIRVPLFLKQIRVNLENTRPREEHTHVPVATSLTWRDFKCGSEWCTVYIGLYWWWTYYGDRADMILRYLYLHSLMSSPACLGGRRKLW